MPTLVGFGTFAALPEERISEKISRRVLSGDQGMIVWWSIGAGVHVEPHSHANEQIVWMPHRVSRVPYCQTMRCSRESPKSPKAWVGL